jgi:hypothetical protein
MILLPLFRLACRPVRRVVRPALIARPRRIFKRAGTSATGKTALLGGLVCTGIPLGAILAPHALDLPWRQETAPLQLVETYTPPFDLGTLNARGLFSGSEPVFSGSMNYPPASAGDGLFPSPSTRQPALSSATPTPSAGRERVGIPVSVPEPSSLALFVAALVGLVVIRRDAA